jgi:hypothetical protein
LFFDLVVCTKKKKIAKDDFRNKGYNENQLNNVFDLVVARKKYSQKNNFRNKG